MSGGVGIGSLKRFGTICAVFARHGFKGLLNRALGKGQASGGPVILPEPAGVRRAFEDLGPSFIKLGQLLGSRADILPPALVDELKKLQDEVPPVPFDQVRPLMAAEWGQEPDRVLDHVNPVPVAAASVAQVHEARLSDGTRVAVKVVRPGIRGRVKEDIRLMYFFAQKLEAVLEQARVVGAVNVVREFERSIFREMDMHIEAGSMEKFSENFRLIHEIHIPPVHWDLTTKSILVMDFVDGVKVDDVRGIRNLGLDPKNVAMIGLRSFSRQLMEYGFFHADPHPGNTIVMPDGRVGLVDFGITGYLGPELMAHIAGAFYGFAEHDFSMVMDALLDAGIVDPDTCDIKAFQIDLADVSEPFYGRSLQTISIKDVYDQTVGLALKHNIRLPANLLLFFKTLVQTEALGKILESDANILEVMKPYAKKNLDRFTSPANMAKLAGKDMRRMGDYLRKTPALIHGILKNTAKGTQGLSLRHGLKASTRRQFERGVNRLTVGMIISASTIAGAMVLNSSIKFLEFEINLFGVHQVSLTQILGITGYGIATFLGIWLIISIFRSGRL